MDDPLNQVLSAAGAIGFVLGFVAGLLVGKKTTGCLSLSVLPVAAAAFLLYILATDKAAWEDGFSVLAIFFMLIVVFFFWLVVGLGWGVGRAVRIARQ
jgi:hypothetical protein